MSEERYFLGIDHGCREGDRSAGILVVLDGDAAVGVLTSFKVARNPHPIFQLEDGTYEVGKEMTQHLPIKRVIIDEEYLQALVNGYGVPPKKEPPQKTYPAPKRKRGERW